jgi:hypothetical protein
MALELAAVHAETRPMKLQVSKSHGASNEYASRPLLAALPDCLTELQVTADEGMLDVLTRLKHLRKLCINQGAMPRWMLQSETLTSLTSLTCLELHRAASKVVGATRVTAGHVSAGLPQVLNLMVVIKTYVCMHAQMARDSGYPAVVKCLFLSLSSPRRCIWRLG